MNVTRHRLALATTTALLALGAAGIFLRSDSIRITGGDPEPEASELPTSEVSTAPNADTADDESPSPLPQGGQRNTKDNAVELVGSVYDLNMAEREAAITNAHRTMENRLEDVLRWRPVAIDTSQFIVGDYKDPSSFPESIVLTPFDDLRIVADFVELKAYDGHKISVWTGKIRDADNGFVTVSVSEQDGQELAIAIEILGLSTLVQIWQYENYGPYVAIERITPTPREVSEYVVD